MTQPEAAGSEDPVTAEGLSALWYGAIAAWLAQVQPAVMASVALGGLPDPSAMWQFQDFWNRQVDRIMAVEARLSKPGWMSSTGQLGTVVAWDPRDPELLETLQRTRNLMVRLPDRTYRDVLRAIATGIDAGEDNAQIARRVNNILSITGSENWPHRAAVIGRTEVNRFFEAGALAGARAAQRDEGRAAWKKWKDRDDASVRNSHARVDNQLRRLGEPFEVGRSLLQHPIDPSGYVDDVVNCRCELDYVWGAR